MTELNEYEVTDSMSGDWHAVTPNYTKTLQAVSGVKL